MKKVSHRIAITVQQLLIRLAYNLTVSYFNEHSRAERGRGTNRLQSFEKRTADRPNPGRVPLACQCGNTRAERVFTRFQPTSSSMKIKR